MEPSEDGDIVITIGSLSKSILVTSDELSTVMNFRCTEAELVHKFRELLRAWLSIKKYELGDFKKYGKR